MGNRKPRRDSDRCSIVNRTVSFNIEDPFQAQLLDAVDSWTNFSGSVKRLLAASLSDGGNVQTQTHAQSIQNAGEPILSVSGDVETWDPTELF